MDRITIPEDAISISIIHPTMRDTKLGRAISTLIRISFLEELQYEAEYLTLKDIPRSLGDWTVDSNREVMVVAVNGYPCGVLTIMTANLDILKFNTITGLYIGKEFRGLGLGTKLLKSAIEHIRTKNPHRIELTVDKDNTVANKLYKSVGFVSTGSQLALK